MGAGAVRRVVQAGQLEVALEHEFGGEAKVVVREAVDLHDSGHYQEDVGVRLTVGTVLSNLRDAPADCGDAVDRWNWWLGSLALAHGDHYSRFTVRRSPDVDDAFQ